MDNKSIYRSHKALVCGCQLFIGGNGQVVNAYKVDPVIDYPISTTFCQCSVVCLEGSVVHEPPADSASNTGDMQCTS